jgi:TRAP-type C4-dicarboxylate transport system substrate-binding protein
VQKYLVLTGHIITPRLVVVNEKFWQGLKPDDQKLLQDAVNAGIAWQNAELIRQERELVDTMKASGMTVVDVDVEAFRKPVVAAVVPKFEGRWGKGTYQQLQNIK